MLVFGCSEQEQVGSSYKCEPCGFGYHNQGQNLKQSCQLCPRNGQCPGWYQGIQAQKGYWIDPKITRQKVLKCRNFMVCQGSYFNRYYGINQDKFTDGEVLFIQNMLNKNQQNNQYGILCEKGYQGILCNQCQENYYKIGLYICGKCHSGYIVIFKFLGLMIVHIGFIVYMGYENEKNYRKELQEKYLKVIFGYFLVSDGDISVIKIIVGYFQFMYILFNLLPSVSVWVSVVMDSLFSPITYSSNIMCVLPLIFKGNSEVSRVIYQFLEWNLEGLLAVLIQRAFKLGIQQRSIMISTYYISSTSMITSISNTVLFSKIGDNFYVYGDYSIKWGSQQYFEQNFMVGIIFICFYIVFIPLMMVYVIRKYSKLPERKIYGEKQLQFLLQYNNMERKQKQQQQSISMTQSEIQELNLFENDLSANRALQIQYQDNYSIDEYNSYKESFIQQNYSFDIQNSILQYQQNKNAFNISWRNINRRYYSRKYGLILGNKINKSKQSQNRYILQRYILQSFVIVVSAIEYKDVKMSVLLSAYLIYLGKNIFNPPFSSNKVNRLNLEQNIIILVNLVLIYCMQNIHDTQMENEKLDVILYVVVLVVYIVFLVMNTLFILRLIWFLLPSLQKYMLYLEYYTQEYKVLNKCKCCLRQKVLRKKRQAKINWDLLRQYIRLNRKLSQSNLERNNFYFSKYGQN